LWPSNPDEGLFMDSLPVALVSAALAVLLIVYGFVLAA
jgi:hypothetical protein